MRARIWRGLAEEDAVQRTKTSHRAIYAAISNRDPELAHAAAAMHIAEVESWFRRLLETRESVPPPAEHPGNGREDEPVHPNGSNE